MKAIFNYSPNVECSPYETELESVILNLGKPVNHEDVLVCELKNNGFIVSEDTILIRHENFLYYQNEQDFVIFSMC